MEDEQYSLRVSARTHRLTAGSDNRFSGIAVRAGDILHMDDGTPVLMTAEELEKAAETQANEPLTVDHPRDEDDKPIYPPPTDATVGRIPKAGWLSSVEAVGYEAVTHDDEIAKGIQAGSYDVSVHPVFQLGEQDPETGAYIARNIRFRDLSVVSKGDSPHNTAEWGPNRALAAYTKSEDFDRELSTSAQSSSEEHQPGTVQRAVKSTLRAVGIEFDEEAESSTSDEDNTEMEDEIEEEEEEETLEEEEEQEESPEKTISDMTVDELGEALREQGFVTTDNAADVVESVTAEQTKAEKVDEIIASSDDFEEDDRESLMASAPKMIEREHKRVRGELAASIPGNAGIANVPGLDSNDADEYGTGVAGDH